MKQLVTIGEALIDFIPETKGQRLKDVASFRRVAGGAPANVAGSVARLGGKSCLLSALGRDAFGDYIIDCLKESGIDTQYIVRNDAADTSLAFVSLAADGNRDFKFYRRTAADLQFQPEQIPQNVLKNAGAIHFCSVDLVESPMKQAHRRLIEMAREEGVIISFDPNLRLSLWEDEQALKKSVREFLPYADIIKLSDEELEFITGKTEIEEALDDLLQGEVKLVLYTKGKDGAVLYRGKEKVMVEGHAVTVRDTTGAGDSFIGAFLYMLLKDEVSDLFSPSLSKLQEYLYVANAYAACTTTKEGALASLADQAEFEAFKKTLEKE